MHPSPGPINFAGLQPMDERFMHAKFTGNFSLGNAPALAQLFHGLACFGLGQGAAFSFAMGANSIGDVQLFH